MTIGIGSVVTLKGGLATSPKMTITRIFYPGSSNPPGWDRPSDQATVVSSPIAECVWFDNEEHLQREPFPVDLLDEWA